MHDLVESFDVDMDTLPVGLNSVSDKRTHYLVASDSYTMDMVSKQLVCIRMNWHLHQSEIILYVEIFDMKVFFEQLMMLM